MKSRVLKPQTELNWTDKKYIDDQKDYLSLRAKMNDEDELK